MQISPCQKSDPFNFLDQGQFFQRFTSQTKAATYRDGYAVLKSQPSPTTTTTSTTKADKPIICVPQRQTFAKNETQIKQHELSHRHPLCPSLALLCSGGCTQNLFFLFLESIERNRSSSLESWSPFSTSLECFVNMFSCFCHSCCDKF